MTESEFKTLFEKYNAQLTGFAFVRAGNVQDAEDIVQTVFLKLWKRGGIGLINGSTYMDDWLYKCVHRESLNHIKMSGRRIRRHERVAEKCEPTIESCEKYFESLDLKAAVLSIVLTEIRSMIKRAGSSQQVLKLYFVDHLSPQEIEKIVGISESTVRVLAKRLRDKIQKNTDTSETYYLLEIL